MSEELAAVAAPAQSEPSAPQTGGIHQAYDHRIGESSSEGAEPKAGAQANAETDVKAAKKPSAYYQIRQAKKAFKAQQEAFQREREAFNRERQAAQEAAKPKRDYTVGELQKYRAEWEREGRYDLVDAADKEIAVMQAEADAERKARTVEMPAVGSPEHKAQWEAAERELFEADPDFMRTGTRLDSRLREIMASQDGNIYRQHPRGIVAAYHRVKMELLEADTKSLRTELEKRDQELKRYQGLTSIGGGAGARVNGGGGIESLADFAKLSTKDMRKHLLASAKREGGSWF
jgi:hypothetical protein